MAQISSIPSLVAIVVFAAVLLSRSDEAHAFSPLQRLSSVASTTTRSSPSSSFSRLAPLGPVIQSEEIDFDFDVGQGGVRLAEESAVQIVGTVKHRPGKAEAQVKDLLRFTQLTPVKENAWQKEYPAIKIITTGRGKELYKNPGETTEKVVILAPLDAVRDSLNAAGSAMECQRIVINFCGGNDLQVLEVLQAVETMVLDLDIMTKAAVSFHSISHASLPLKQAFVTVVGLPEESLSGGRTNVDKALANGEIYFANGQYWTVSEEHLNTAVA